MFSFFQNSHRVGKKPVCSVIPTLVLKQELSEDGSLNLAPVVLEKVLEPLCTLDFTDFMLSECLKHGVNYKSLQISSDLRLGHDEEINALNQRVVDMSDELFELPKTK